MTFADNGVSIGTGRSSSGDTASYTTSTLQLAAGTDTITAVYGGDVNYGVSTSAAYLQTVSQATTSITLAQPSTSVYGQSVTFTATVTNTEVTSSLAPVGTVTFEDGGNVDRHRASQRHQHEQHGHAHAAPTSVIDVVALHTLTAMYNGDGVNFAGTTPSTTVTQSVGQASTTTTVASSTATGTSVFGQTVTFTATLIAVSPARARRPAR